MGNATAPERILPAYGSGCVNELIPTMLGGGPSGSLPVDVSSAAPRVLIVLDGLGWDQLTDRWHLAPTLKSFSGGPITTVAPSTTATALTSITTGLTPGEHGIVGYRMVVDDDVLNCLRWRSDDRGDVRKTTPPDLVQPYPPFLGQSVSMVSKAEFRTSGFSKAHLRGARLTGYRTPAVMVHEVARMIREGEQFVYAYYDGVDKIAHEYGLDSTYEAEVAFADRLVGDIVDALPTGTDVVVTADHGQVDCGGGLIDIDSTVASLTNGLSGEGRFRWLHSIDGGAADLLTAAEDAHGHHAWIASLEQIIDEGWFGPSVSPEARRRLGDVAMLPWEPIAFDDPADSGLFELVSRHGSLTSSEMVVPLLGATT